MPLTSYISQSSGTGVTFKVIKTQFGNGYSQRRPDGINNRMENLSITWEYVSAAQKTTILAALDATDGSDYITYNSNRYIVSEYNISEQSGDIFTINATFEQVYDL